MELGDNGDPHRDALSTFWKETRICKMTRLNNPKHYMRSLIVCCALVLLGSTAGFARVVVFWQDGFPTVASQPVTKETLITAFKGSELSVMNLESFKDPAALSSADLLVLPYGSAIRTDAWPIIHRYLEAGGNLLGGQPFRVPVIASDGKFRQARPQDTFSRELDFRHAYEVSQQGGTKFAWRSGYSFLRAPEIRADRSVVPCEFCERSNRGKVPRLVFSVFGAL